MRENGTKADIFHFLAEKTARVTTLNVVVVVTKEEVAASSHNID